MNRKVCLICIFYFVYQFINCLQSRSIVLIIYNLIGILMLTSSLIWDMVKSNKNQDTKKRVVPYANFAFLYFIIGVQIELDFY